MLRNIASGLRSLLRKEQVSQELDEELRCFLEMAIEEKMNQGMSRKNALRELRLERGTLEFATETVRSAGWESFLETWWQDLRFGLRMLRKNAMMASVVIVTLALAIGVNTTIFTVVSGWLVRKPPVHDPDHVVVVSSVNPAKDIGAADRTPVSLPDYLDYRSEASSFTDLAAASENEFTISGDASPQKVFGTRVSPNYFQVLGVAPALGRTFLPAETQSGQDQVVILSDELWKGSYGADPHVLGRSIKVNKNRYTVVGVMPAEFRLQMFPAQIWVPLVFSQADLAPSARSSRSLTVFARLKPGIDERHARTEMQGIAQRIAQTHKDTDENWGASVMTLQRFIIASGNAEPALVFLMATVGFVLLIACTNLANLLLARNSARQLEFSIRSALGAGGFRLARQLLTECLLLSFLGGGLGILLAFWGIRALRSQINWSEYAVSLAKDIAIDSRVLLFTVAVSVLAAIFFGLAPALQVSRCRTTGGLREGGRSATAGPGRHRLQRLLVVGQLALSLFLLVGAGLFVEGFREIVHTSIGFNPRNLLTASVSLRGLEYLQPQRQKQFFDNVRQRLAGVPGTQSAALASDLPFSFPKDTQFTVEGHPVAKKQDEPSCGYFVVSPEYFSTTQTPLLRGRELKDSDTVDAAPVVIVNDAFAKRFLGGEDPIGRRIRIERHRAAGQNQWSEIVGLVGNVDEFLGQKRARPEIYLPFAANPEATMRLIIRTSTQPGSLSDSLRQAVWAVDPDQAVTEVRTMDNVIADSAQGDDLMAELMGGFALLALIMAAVGIFGVLSYLVGQRMQEMGVRSALGAQPMQLLKLVMGSGMSLVGLGTAIGFLASLALPKIVISVFQGLTAHSGWVLGLAPVILVLTGLAACFVPARRAMRVDPMVALRCE